MSLQKQAAAVKSAIQAIVDAAKKEERELTVEEAADIEAKADEYRALVARIEAAEKAADTVANLAVLQVKEPEPVKGKTLGERFVNSPGFRKFREDHPTGVGSGTPIRIEAKGVGDVYDFGIGAKATIDSTTGQISPQREAGYRDYLKVDEPLTFLDLVTVGTTTVAYSEYAQVVSETNKAAVVAEGELKPLSDVTTSKEESKAYTYADGFDVTNQTLQDDGALVAYMEARIRRHVLGVVEAKLLNGTGTGTEPKGILNTSGTLAQAFDTDAVTTLARALAVFQENNGESVSPQAIVLNAADVWDMRLLKDTTGNYLLGNPLQQGPIPTPWGVPLVSTTRIPKGTALVGRFDSVNFLQLEPLNVLAFNQHKDYAQRNMVYVRAEMRGRQLFYAPREVVVAKIAAGADEDGS